jgi:SAM-dependent methyltransferase
MAIRTRSVSDPALRLLNGLMTWRARELAARVAPLLPGTGEILDIGSGTGHNGAYLRRLRPGRVSEVDVVDFSVVGPGPALFDGRRMPFSDARFDAVTMIYVLHYAPDPVALLKEARRVCRGSIVVVQTVCEGSAGPRLHRVNEAISRLGFHAARLLGVINSVPCPLHSREDLSREALLQIVRRAGLAPGSLRAERHLPCLPLSRITCSLVPFEPRR